jgi:hypothetical protein
LIFHKQIILIDGGGKERTEEKNAVRNYPCILIISAMCVRLRGSHASLHPHTIRNKPAKSAIASTVAVAALPSLLCALGRAFTSGDTEQ